MKRIRLNDYEQELDRRVEANGFSGRDFVRQNSGVARTPEKRALLRKLFEMMRANGRRSPFSANI
jgi:hypothetical protein